jgi:tetratricopeptide (TPR) repeat protein
MGLFKKLFGRGDPETAGEFVHRGVRYLEKGEHEKAVAAFTAAIELDPRLLPAYMNRGGAYAALGRLDLAVADYSSVLQIAPHDDLARWALYMRAQMYDLQEDHDQAIADYTEIIRLDPQDPVNFCNRGNAYVAKRDFERAIADLTEAVRVGPDEPTAHHSLAWLLATCREPRFRDGQKAMAHARKACELTDWSDTSYFFSLAAAYAEVGQFDEAVKWQKKALESPDLPDDELEDAQLRLQLYEEGKPFLNE